MQAVLDFHVRAPLHFKQDLKHIDCVPKGEKKLKKEILSASW